MPDADPLVEALLVTARNYVHRNNKPRTREDLENLRRAVDAVDEARVAADDPVKALEDTFVGHETDSNPVEVRSASEVLEKRKWPHW